MLLSAALLMVLSAAPTLDDVERELVAGKPEVARVLFPTLAPHDGLPLPQTLRRFALEGEAFADFSHDRAVLAFKSRLMLDPAFRPRAGATAAVQKAFAEAKAWTDVRLLLDFQRREPSVQNGRVVQLAVKVKNDALSLAKSVRFGVRLPGEAWKLEPVELTGSSAALATDAEALEWYAELLGTHGNVLANLGTAEAPLRDGRLPPVSAGAPGGGQALTPPTPVRRPLYLMKLDGGRGVGPALLAKVTAGLHRSGLWWEDRLVSDVDGGAPCAALLSVEVFSSAELTLIKVLAFDSAMKLHPFQQALSADLSFDAAFDRLMAALRNELRDVSVRPR